MSDWIRAAVVEIARAAADAGAWAAGAHPSGLPIVEVEVAGDRVSFVFDYLLLFTAQSGSDWYEHHVFAGRGRIADGALTDVTTEERLSQNVSEHAVEWADPPYDRGAVVRSFAH